MKTEAEEEEQLSAAVLAGLLEKLQRSVKMFSCLPTVSSLFPAAVRGRPGALGHGGPDAGRGAAVPTSVIPPQDAVRGGCHAPGTWYRGHAKSSGCRARPFGVSLGSLSLTRV